MENYPYANNIKNWNVNDRPREKLMANGSSSLSDSELLSILIGTGTRNKTAVQLAKELLHSVQNNLDVLGKTPLSEIKKINGIGSAKAVTIVAALELGRRRASIDLPERPAFYSSEAVSQYMGPRLADLIHEEFWILFLSRSLRLITKQKLFSGGLHSVSADVKMIIKKAVEHSAGAIVLVHNHPSGSPDPSEADIIFTNKVKEACLIFDISLSDHVIVAGKNYYSFRDNIQI